MDLDGYLDMRSAFTRNECNAYASERKVARNLRGLELNKLAMELTVEEYTETFFFYNKLLFNKKIYYFHSIALGHNWSCGIFTFKIVIFMIFVANFTFLNNNFYDRQFGR